MRRTRRPSTNWHACTSQPGKIERASFYYGLLAKSSEATPATLWLGLKIARAQGDLRTETALGNALRNLFRRRPRPDGWQGAPSMSDDLSVGTGPDAPVDAAAEAPPPASFGARLQWQRERLGLTVTDVAARLRLHPNQVRALEQEATLGVAGSRVCARLRARLRPCRWTSIRLRCWRISARNWCRRPPPSSMAWRRHATIRRCAPRRASMPRARSSWPAPCCC